MRWADVRDGVWVLPFEKGEKSNAGTLILPPIVLDILEEQRKRNSENGRDDNPYVFASRNGSHLSGYSKAKRLFDAKCPTAQWGLHDLRRTARSLMSRAQVWDRHAEVTMGHVIAGVEGTYDRHQYRDEKAEALRKLAGLIATILAPQTKNVVALKTA